MINSFFQILGSRADTFLQPSAEPIRADLLSLERLEGQAEILASGDRVTTRAEMGRPILPRLRENAKILADIYKDISTTARAEQPITPAAEWLLDNFHIVEEQIREILDDMPAGFYRRLPKLTNGQFAGYPRIFGIAWDIVAHTDSGFDEERLTQYITAYQRVQPLTIGELWALAITLRLTLVENLRRIALSIAERHAAYQAANAIADRLTGIESESEESIKAVLRSLSSGPLSRPLAVQLSQQLRDQDQRVIPALHWIEERLAAEGTTTDQIVRDEHQYQGAMNVTVRNIITSMRLVSRIDWPEFVESVSLVDVALRAASDFAEMDFPTRDMYRRAIEKMARGSGLSELEVARRVVAAVKQAPEGLLPGDSADRRRDPGYYLISRGQREFEDAIGFRRPFARLLSNPDDALSIRGYIALVVLVTCAILALALLGAAHHGVADFRLLLLALFGLIPASDLALALVNQAAIDRFGPAVLPGLELEDGVPAELRTMIVVPTLLTSRDDIEELIKNLEVHYLSSADGELYYALLSDWTDSDAESAPDDEVLLTAAREGIAALNRHYAPGPGGPRFYLLHRRRSWNESQRKWIGWERKRGKLHEFNRLLRGATDTTFIPVDGEPITVPEGVRYVITLDSDTRLPRGAAKRLIGKMAHALNRPRIDPLSLRVVEGHGILQPRVTPSLPMGRGGSLFQRAFSGANGLDPYAFAVSDIYQDLFEEGSYVGKGIYDVDCFEAALHGRIPESTVLSHDLIEGIFTRAALASDVELVEEYPSRYDVAAARQHRWVRGDWQLLPWIFGRGREKDANRHKAVIPLIGRWKMLDNLRRSLSAPSALVALIFGWTLPLSSSAFWTGFILETIAFPLFMPTLLGLIPNRIGISKRSHLRGLGADIALATMQSAFLITFLAHQAWLMLDAALRTLFRLFARRRLLEWTTAAQLSYLRSDWRSLTVQFGSSALFGVASFFVIYSAHSNSWPLAVPFIALWMVSPALAKWASEDTALAGHLEISDADRRSLRSIARQTWRFFETFITAENNMLPPDNFQEDPAPVIANRTSPTNIGLYLLTVSAARDFGWSGVIDSLARWEETFATLARLERFRGHFYNWYDTHDLRPLEPKYISSVDSGNLAGHLITLGSVCREIIVSPLWDRFFAGLSDTLGLARDAAQGLAGQTVKEPLREKLEAALDLLAKTLDQPAPDPVTIAGRLVELEQNGEAAVAIAKTLETESGGNAVAAEALRWTQALQGEIASHRRDLDAFAPWAVLLAGNSPDLSPAASRWITELRQRCSPMLDAKFSLASAPDLCRALLEIVAGETENHPAPALRDSIMGALKASAKACGVHAGRLMALAETAETMYRAMDFGFLFDRDRQLLSIGYQVNENRLDDSYYDLLASEARLASFVAIAKGDLPGRHWFRLGRTLTPVDRGSALLSWSGSMFEYLMPSLVMRAPAGSLLEHTNRLIVRRQISYGAELGVPWGVSESEYNARDLEFTYQYSGFGVPDLGYKRGLTENIVIAPYATGLAAMVDPGAAARNFERLAEDGGKGHYGWYEALDYTPERLPEGAKVAVIQAYMAHHQAMTIIGIANAVHDGAIRARFHAQPEIRSTELLLQERMPRGEPVARPPARRPSGAVAVHQIYPEMQRRFNSPHSRVPRTHLLSNGRYSVMFTGAGSGYSRWGGIDITRWREDTTCDAWGSYIFLRDTRTGDVWSTGYQPSGVAPETYEVLFSEDRAEIIREDSGITTALILAVSPEDDAEVRRISITNHGVRTREIELTSYAEIALAAQADDQAHQAFSKLFVETEFLPNSGAIIAHRRPRGENDPQIWAAHLTVVEGESLGDVQFETDRLRFLGRGHTIRKPSAVAEGWPLSNSAGAVLDPIFSLRRRVRLPRAGTARIAFWTLAASSREALLSLIDKHQDAMAFERATTFAWTQAQIQLHHLGVGPLEAHLYQRIANRVIYSDATLRPASEVLQRGARCSSTLWANGISGDLPIVLVRIEESEDLGVVRQMLRAFEYWRMKQLAVDLVIMNERPASYVQDLQNSLETMLRTSRVGQPDKNVRGIVTVLRADLVSAEVQGLLQTAARVVILARRGNLTEQIRRIPDIKPGTIPPSARRTISAAPALAITQRPQLEFFNGFGGFADKGREYVTILEKDQWTPAPWINVIANSAFGFHVSTDGSGFTWSINSQQNQITAWSNDPVRDPPGEVIYIRDEETGELWTPTALPIREETAYLILHGRGYTRFEHESHGISLSLLQYVPVDDPIKISRLTIENRSGKARRLSVTAYVEWVLGTSRGVSAPFVITELDPATGAIFARNPWNNDFGERVAFVDLRGQQTGWTGDRTEFLGRNGALDWPAALSAATTLSKTVGAGLDPCAALQASIALEPGASTEIVVLLGETGLAAEGQALIEKYRQADLDAVLDAVGALWEDVLGAVQVKTPDRAMDILLNGWLPYQTLACRVWARAGFYQASGAYGFRDQLQDVMALCIARPQIAREHILRAAARQFPEGDVQHWWLPETGRGIRTQISDDVVWLPYVVGHYIEVTGDSGILDETVPFLEGPALAEGQHEAFFQPTVSDKKATLFEHCARGLDRSLATGAHGLPLMGTGDWNDGMNAVGVGGKGESVWLGWILQQTLVNFSHTAIERRDTKRAAAWMLHAAVLKESLEQSWDGDWYRRAYFDDGTPIGSIANAECTIDSIAQSWSVISRAGEPARAARAMAAVEKYLVKRDDGLVLLFTPPFSTSVPNPGYIQGYPQGIRENGGQYTHAAAWSILAYAMLGDGDKAAELFSIVNPINHGSSHAAIHRYRIEPYVIAGDLYSKAPQVGRGGWSWYSGSASWMYRVGLEGILGFHLCATRLKIDPSIPRAWPGFEIAFRYRSARYDIAVENPAGVSRGVVRIDLDGEVLSDINGDVPLEDDGATHRVRVVMG